MASIQDRLREASAKNNSLLQTLSQTDHAIPSLSAQNRLIADLQSEIAASEARLKKLDAARKKELKDHEKYRDSVMRRFAYKATLKSAKFEAKAQKEETEYFAALQDEHREGEINRNLKERLVEAQKVAGDLNEVVRRHNSAQKELDNLYDRLFKGETPGFPEEDEKEQIVERLLREYQDAKERAESEQHAIRLLGEAQYRMRGALRAVEEALQHSRVDMFGGGTFNDMMERNALHKAETEVMGARMLVLQAQRFAPPGTVWDLPEVNINHGNVMMDVFFDNIFTDMQFHEEIKASRARVERAARVLDEMIAKANQRVKGVGDELSRLEKKLTESREELQKVRANVFKRVAEGQAAGTDSPAPAYKEVDPSTGAAGNPYEGFQASHSPGGARQGWNPFDPTMG
ncbi:hypothetical protein QBC37DRAFT_172511 [Rhypophila decipiens]|uniref:Uncharacterized protein n=1 Tax=Rhypophila decipiens TaxID=261697 RepID=A0AAN7B7X8_9PEZI|nr:hypothetical protein QBC37DRAFT_172511 [Rhypophila decipiens]